MIGKRVRTKGGIDHPIYGIIQKVIHSAYDYGDVYTILFDNGVTTNYYSSDVELVEPEDFSKEEYKPCTGKKKRCDTLTTKGVCCECDSLPLTQRSPCPRCDFIGGGLLCYRCGAYR